MVGEVIVLQAAAGMGECAAGLDRLLYFFSTAVLSGSPCSSVSEHDAAGRRWVPDCCQATGGGFMPSCLSDEALCLAEDSSDSPFIYGLKVY